MSPNATDQILGQSPDERPEETWQRLDSISQLLHHAARQVWGRADEDSPASALHSLGLGIYLAHAQAHQLLPEDYDVVDVDLVDDDRTALQLLTEAEELSRPLPLARADLVHGSQLVVDLCDLIREAQNLDC
jgi:hypothetical protein